MRWQLLSLVNTWQVKALLGYVGESMREISHSRGRNYTRLVEKWITNCTILGKSQRLIGNAYDASQYAVKLGENSFDLSFGLSSAKDTDRVLFVECKYRSERDGHTNGLFTEFVDHVVASSETCSRSEIDSYDFCFISNLPPKEWPDFLKDRGAFLVKNRRGKHRLQPDRIHVLVLSQKILGDR